MYIRSEVFVPIVALAAYTYVLLVELGHSNFSLDNVSYYCKWVLKMFYNGTVLFGFCLVSSLLTMALLF